VHYNCLGHSKVLTIRISANLYQSSSGAHLLPGDLLLLSYDSIISIASEQDRIMAGQDCIHFIPSALGMSHDRGDIFLLIIYDVSSSRIIKTFIISE
jgi:hypothetical protein